MYTTRRPHNDQRGPLALEVKADIPPADARPPRKESNPQQPSRSLPPVRKTPSAREPIHSYYRPDPVEEISFFEFMSRMGKYTVIPLYNHAIRPIGRLISRSFQSLHHHQYAKHIGKLHNGYKPK